MRSSDGAPERFGSDGPLSDVENDSAALSVLSSSHVANTTSAPSTPSSSITARDISNHSSGAHVGGYNIFQGAMILAAALFAVLAAVATGVTVYFVTRATLEAGVADRGQTILRGALAQLDSTMGKMVGAVENIHNEVGSRSAWWPDLASSRAEMNKTIFEAWSQRIATRDEMYAFSLKIMWPPAPSIPAQSYEEQTGCFDICARPGDPTYTNSSSFSMWYDILWDGHREYRWATAAADGLLSDTYSLQWANTTNGPRLIYDKFLYAYDATKNAVNGSFLQGNWIPPELWVGTDGTAYYYLSYRRMYRFDHYSYVVTAFDTLRGWYDIVSAFVNPEDNGEYMLLTDTSDRVLAFSRESADPRLTNCSEERTGGSAFFAACDDLSARTHNHWFVRALFRDHRASIITGGTHNYAQWVDIDGVRYLLIVRDVLRLPSSKVIAVYAISEAVALGGLVQRTIITVVATSSLVALATAFLVALGVVALRQTRLTVRATAAIAQHVAHYDVSGARDALHALKLGNRDLEHEFRVILHNLDAYRPFIPKSLIKQQHCQPPDQQDEGDEAGEDGSQGLADDAPASAFSTSRLRSHRFRQVRGSVMVVDLLNLSTSSTRQTTMVVDRFLQVALPLVEQHGGVVDLVQANQLVVTFNYHVPVLRHEDAASRCAVAVRRELMGLMQCQMSVAVAVAGGANLVGTVGTDMQKSRVVTGEGVDLAHRLVSLQRRIGAGVLVTESVADKSMLFAVPVDVVAPTWLQDGRTRAVPVYEVSGTTRKDPPTWAAAIAEGFQLLRVRRFAEAAIRLRTVDTVQGRRLLHVCEQLGEQHEQSGSIRPATYERHELHWEPIEDLDLLSSLGDSSSTRDQGDRFGGADTPDACALRIVMQGIAASRPAVAFLDDPSESLFPIFVREEDSLDTLPSTHSTTSAHTDLGGIALPDTITDMRGVTFHRSKKVLGRGQFGEVFLAMDEEGTLVALKTFPITDQEEDSSCADLIHEVEVLSKLRHESIAAYVSCAVLEHHFCIMMEYLSAGSLRWVISPERYGRVPTRVLVSYLRDILRGLQFLHEQHYVHCDIKPDNILLTGDGTCKLADFGTATLVTAAQHLGGSRSICCKSITSGANETPAVEEALQDAMVRGTPRYMAPEAARGDWGPAADIYSVGITIVELATGQHPFRHVKGNDLSFLMRLTAGDVPPVEVNPLPTAELRNVVEQCLQKDPRQRPRAGALLMLLGT